MTQTKKNGTRKRPHSSPAVKAAFCMHDLVATRKAESVEVETKSGTVIAVAPTHRDSAPA
jgi:hypothetical protein